MSEDQFVALNTLEVKLVEATKGRIPLTEFLRVLVASELAVASGSEVLADGSGMNPFVFDKDGTQMVAVYTDRERVKSLGEPAHFCLVMTGRDFIERLPPGFGIVVNPGFSAGLDISPSGINDIRRDFCL